MGRLQSDCKLRFFHCALWRCACRGPYVHTRMSVNGRCFSPFEHNAEQPSELHCSTRILLAVS